MANVNKLFVNTKPFEGEPHKGQNAKKVYFTNDKNNPTQKTPRKVYFNDILVWQSGYNFFFVNSLDEIDLSKLDSNTLIFTNFNNNQKITGVYNLVENLETEKPEKIGEMIAIKVAEGDD